MSSDAGQRLLRVLAGTLRERRKAAGWSRRELAERADVSERFLADIETGKANPSLLKLCDLATALGTDAIELLGGAADVARTEQAPVIALLGLRGAGKSTIGAALAEALDCPFVELDQEIETATGLGITQIFQIYDQDYFRQAEHDALRSLLMERPRPFVVATGGGLVTERPTYELLRAHARTVWLRAKPEEHWSRVLEQGDTRPMKDHDRAFAALCTILDERQNLYEQAEITVDTSGRSVEEVTSDLLRVFQPG